MSRKQKILEKCEEIIEEGRKPSVGSLHKELSWMEEDIHRLLNALEKDGEIETYTRNVLGQKKRLVSIYR